MLTYYHGDVICRGADRCGEKALQKDRRRKDVRRIFKILRTQDSDITELPSSFGCIVAAKLTFDIRNLLPTLFRISDNMGRHEGTQRCCL